MKGKNMKKTLMILVVASALMMSGCVRSSIDEPIPGGQSGQRFVIEGWANPYTLYIPRDLTPQVTTILVRLYAYDNVPVAGRQVLFQQMEGNGLTGMSWGVFEGNNLSIKKTVDAQGYVQVNYYFPGAYTVFYDTMIIIKASLIHADNMRVEVSDLIPVYLKVYNN